MAPNLQAKRLGQHFAQSSLGTSAKHLDSNLDGQQDEVNNMNTILCMSTIVVTASPHALPAELHRCFRHPRGLLLHHPWPHNFSQSPPLPALFPYTSDAASLLATIESIASSAATFASAAPHAAPDAIAAAAAAATAAAPATATVARSAATATVTSAGAATTAAAVTTAAFAGYATTSLGATLAPAPTTPLPFAAASTTTVFPANAPTRHTASRCQVVPYVPITQHLQRARVPQLARVQPFKGYKAWYCLRLPFWGDKERMTSFWVPTKAYLAS